MIFADFECPSHHISEHMVQWKQKKVECPVCGKTAKRIISVSGQYMGNQDTPWIRSVLEVVDKSNPAAHVQDFIKHPTRETYKAWMKKEKVRPMDYTEHGAPPTAHKPGSVDTSQIRREVLERYKKRNRIEVMT